MRRSFLVPMLILLRSALSHLPQRLATGAFILHSGIDKWHGSSQQAQGAHGMAAGAYRPPRHRVRHVPEGARGR